MMEPQWSWIHARRPRGEDPRAVEEGWYFAENGKVFLCDKAGVRNGVPIRRYAAAITPRKLQQ